MKGRGDFNLVILDKPWAPEFLPAGFLEPLDPCFLRMGKSADEDFIPTSLTLGPLALPTRHPLCLPVLGNLQLCAYKRDLIEKHGLNHPPAKWSVVLDAARILARTGDLSRRFAES